MTTMRREFATVEALQRWLRSEGLGRPVHLTVLHDHICRPEACVCSPEYVAEWLTVGTHAAGAQKQAAWVKAALRRGTS